MLINDLTNATELPNVSYKQSFEFPYVSFTQILSQKLFFMAWTYYVIRLQIQRVPANLNKCVQTCPLVATFHSTNNKLYCSKAHQQEHMVRKTFVKPKRAKRQVRRNRFNHSFVCRSAAHRANALLYILSVGYLRIKGFKNSVATI